MALHALIIIIIIIIIVAANRRRKVQQRRSSTRSNRKHTMAPLAAAIRSMCDLGAQLTASWNRLYAGFCRGGKTGEPGEKPSKQRREPTQTQPTYGVWSENQTSATLVGGECSHHCAIPAPQCSCTCVLHFGTFLCRHLLIDDVK